MIVFSDPVVAEKYESVFNVDKYLTIPGVYRGLLSKINYAGAYKLVKSGDNQLREKPVTAAPKVRATIRTRRTPKS